MDAVWTTKPVHSRRRFILELSPGHPQADTQCDLVKRAESTVSTGPITTPVLHLENFSSKQVVWTSLERTRADAGRRRETRTARRSSGRAAIVGVGGSARLHRSPHSFDGRWPDSFTAPCPHRNLAPATLRRSSAVETRRAPAPEEPGCRTRDRSRIGTRSAAGRRTRHVDVQSRPDVALGRREPKPVRSCPHRYRGTAVDTVTPRALANIGATERTVHRGHIRCSSTAVHSRTRAIGPGSGDTAPYYPPGLAEAPPEDVSSTRRGSRPRSSKRGTV